MISNRYKKLISYVIIFSSLPFFYFYFSMVYRATITDHILSLELSLWTTKLFFIDFWMFHIPGFILIALGIICLWKSKK